MSETNDLKTIRQVVTSDLSGAAHQQALEEVGSRCYYCRKSLAGLPAVAVYFLDDRNPKNWAIYPYMSEGKIVSPGAFAHVACQLSKEQCP